MTDTPSSLLNRLQQEAAPADWKRLVDLYQPLLRNWLKRDPALRAEVDDLIQDILQSVVRKIPDFRRERTGSFRCWLRVITANRVNLFWRQRRNHLPVVDGGEGALLISQLEDPDSLLSRQWDAEHNSYVLQRLMNLIEPEFTAKTWQMFRRHVLDGASTSAVAEELGTTENAVLVARCRILKRLREEAGGLID